MTGSSPDGSSQMTVELGRTGLKVSRLGLGSSYPAPTRSFEEAFERGVNYFYWGSRRRDPMGNAIRTIAKRKRDELVIVVQSYARVGWWMKPVNGSTSSATTRAVSNSHESPTSDRDWADAVLNSHAGRPAPTTFARNTVKLVRAMSALPR